MDGSSGLTPGTRIGPYRIDGLLGVGGMGEVYRAEDTKLRRAVAIKVLPQAVAADPDRLARFQREARLLASLNHPRIGAIFGLEEIGGTPALILELVEGPVLTERLARGPLSLNEATAIAGQLAEALEAAHERGIVHRDLKPANVKFTSEGTVKVLDFGIAKVLAADDDEHTAGTTVTGAVTAMGIVVGTPAYMSPEQAMGQPVDKRADVWAFGCVLFEMLTGRTPFAAGTQAATLAGVLERVPDWGKLPAQTPDNVRWVLTRCLEKDPRERLRDIGEARVALTKRSADRETPPPPRAIGGRAVAAAIAVLVLLAAAFALGRIGRPGATPATTAARVTFAVAPPEGHVFGVGFGPAGFTPNVELVSMAASPDGSQLAFVATSSSTRQIWLRALSAVEARPIDGTENAVSVFWSPDGRSIGFFADNRLKRVDVPNGRPVTICDVPPNTNFNGTWGRDVILFAGQGKIFRVSAAGGTPVIEVDQNPARDELSVGWPWFLPDGRRYLYLSRNAKRDGVLKLGELEGTPTELLPVISSVQWVDPDFVVFVRDGRLLAQRVDLDRRAPVGDPIAISEEIQYSRSTGRANFAASRSGLVVYQPHVDNAELVWLDRKGNETGRVQDQADYTAVRLADDDRTALVSQSDPRLGTYDVWTVDLVRGVRQRVTFDPTSELIGAWLPGNKRIVFSAERGGAPHLYIKDLQSGDERELRPAQFLQVATDVSPDGRTVIYSQRDDKGMAELWLAPVDGASEVTRLARTPFSQSDVRYARDGRHVTLVSNESGRSEVYVASLPNVAVKTPVSSGGGAMGRWSADGKEILYVSGNRLMSARVTRGETLQLAPPTELFSMPQPWRAFEVAQDGRLFAIVPKQLGNAQPVTAVLNWSQP